MTSQNISVQIGRSPADVYAFAAHPRNLPKWATSFCLDCRQVGEKWFVETPAGELEFEFVPANHDGNLDHSVTLPDGTKIQNCMRIVPCDAGSQVTFLLVRQPEMSDEEFDKDAGMIKADLQTLKSVLEATAARC